MSKIWTTAMLRVAIERRGEHLPRNHDVERAVLAFERMKGHTDEGYSRTKAKAELSTILQHVHFRLPPAHGKDYVGLKELRTYAEQAKREWEKDQPEVAFKPLNVIGRDPPRLREPSREPSRETGRETDPEPDHEDRDR